MMTTFAAIFGSLPIALGTGAGAELRQPLGVAVVGGLMLSQLLTLYITPVIYLYLDRFDRMIKRRLEPQLVEVPEAARLRWRRSRSRHSGTSPKARARNPKAANVVHLCIPGSLAELCIRAALREDPLARARNDWIRNYSAKLVPQPQEAVAFGFFTLNEAPIRSSTKSISEPAM